MNDPQNKKQILVLFSYDVYPSGQRAFIGHGDLLNEKNTHPEIEYVKSELDNLIFMFVDGKLSVTDHRTGKDIADFEDVFFQKWFALPQHALAAARYLSHRGRPFVSSEILQQNAFTKLTEMIELAIACVSYPDSLCASPTNFLELAESGKLPFEYPFIIKDIGGSGGSDNHLVEDQAQLEAILANAPVSRSYIAQEFIPNEFDYRITVMGGEIAYVLKRSRQGDSHRNNTTQGGAAIFMEPNELPAEVRAEALKAANVLGRNDFAGVDMIVNDDGQWVLEVNKSPEIQLGVGTERKRELLTDYFYKRYQQRHNQLDES